MIFSLPRHCIGKSKSMRMLDDISSRARVFSAMQTLGGAKKRQKKDTRISPDAL
jgi:hypothetical protein